MNPSRGPWLGAICALTILLGAFLLFQVQPLLSKWILPWFGGGPAVWTTCMLFFQSVLFAGYAYAHFSERCLPPTVRVAVHLGLILAAAAFLPVGPEDGWKPSGPGDPTLRILLLLAVDVGVPYFLLSSTGPLVQAWFSRVYPDRSPYRLYALSNAGSLAALLSYPFVFEPALGLRAQSSLWAWMFLGFAALYSAGTVAAWRAGPPPAAPAEARKAPSAFRHRALWVLLPAFASWMLLAATHQLCQDVAVIPFLWVLPLAAYLLSFIVAFDHPRWYKPRMFAPCMAALAFAAAALTATHAESPLMFVLVITGTLGALFCVCMVCHGELARLKPEPRLLTAYYLAISGGGALGGLLVGLVAPVVFSTVLEWKLGIGIAYTAAWGLIAWTRRGNILDRRNVAAMLLVVAVTGGAFLCVLFGSSGTSVEATRSFYGVLHVKDYAWDGVREGGCRDLISGRIRHGRQYLHPDERRKPTTYYVEASGVGRAIMLFQSRPDLRVGVVGLGVGTLAAYTVQPSQLIRFYEINPEMKGLAERHFTYLGDCRGRTEVAPGDARLSLAGESPQGFHVLALDAFTGDIIPTHLLTVEAMGLYVRHLAPDGVIAVHISNRTLDLRPVVRGVARRHGLETLTVELTVARDEPGDSSTWMLCTRSKSVLRDLGPHAMADGDARETIWTDDHSDLFSVLRLR